MRLPICFPKSHTRKTLSISGEGRRAHPLPILLLLFVANLSFAQKADTLRLAKDAAAPAIQTDSSARKGNVFKNFFVKKYPQPRKAALLATVMPGAGQMYNRKWWKLPIVYGALGGMTYWTVDNVKQYRLLRDEFKARVDDDPATSPNPAYARLENQTVRDYRDLYRKYCEQSYLALGFIYLLSITDAYVDAHMYRFDVSEDLSLRLQPKNGVTPGFGLHIGAGLCVNF